MGNSQSSIRDAPHIPQSSRLLLAGIEFIFSMVAGTGNSDDNTGMFYLLLINDHTASRSFLLLTSPHQRGLGVHRELGGNRAGAADPS